MWQVGSDGSLVRATVRGSVVGKCLLGGLLASGGGFGGGSGIVDNGCILLLDVVGVVLVESNDRGLIIDGAPTALAGALLLRVSAHSGAGVAITAGVLGGTGRALHRGCAGGGGKVGS